MIFCEDDENIVIFITESGNRYQGMWHNYGSNSYGASVLNFVQNEARVAGLRFDIMTKDDAMTFCENLHSSRVITQENI